MLRIGVRGDHAAQGLRRSAPGLPGVCKPGAVTQPARAHLPWPGNGKETEYFIRIGSVALADE